MRLLIFILIFSMNSVHATESDAYTYQYIQINDSSSKVNLMINEILFEVVDKTNKFLKKKYKKNKNYKLTNRTLEYLLAINYFKLMFRDKITEDIFSIFEICIDSNTCSGWPYFERILLYPHESIYAAANYSYITKNFVASTVNVCGIRMGTDKLTHFFMDGFIFYNGTKDDRLNLNFEDIIHISTEFEQSVMGTKFTGVYSKADIEANIRGALFFKDFVSKQINSIHGKKDDKKYLRTQEMDICNYVNDHFNEIVNPNIYLKDKYLDLHLAKRVHSNLLANEDILARKLLNDNMIGFSLFKLENPWLFLQVHFSNKLKQGMDTWFYSKPMLYHRKK